MTNEERRQMRMQQIQQFLDSGLSAMRWMRLNRMSSSTFCLWLNKFRDEDPERFGVRRQTSGEWVAERVAAQVLLHLSPVKAFAMLISFQAA